MGKHIKGTELTATSFGSPMSGYAQLPTTDGT